MIATIEQQKPIQPDLYVPQTAKIVDKKDFTEMESFFRLEFPGQRPLGHEPGQFVEVSILGFGEAPISISSSPTRPEGFDLCVRRVGTVTKAMHGMKVGDTIGIRGPFGRGVPVEKLKGQDLLFVAGGLGFIPLRSSLQYVLDRRSDYGKVMVLYGVKTPAEFLYRDELEDLRSRDDVEYLETVDRPDPNWHGHTGVITTLFPSVKFDPKNTTALIVGPPVMYKFVILALTSRGLKDDRMIVSLERRMKCGVGKCGHCQINHKYVCQDGPTFSYAELKTMKEAFS